MKKRYEVSFYTTDPNDSEFIWRVSDLLDEVEEGMFKGCKRVLAERLQLKDAQQIALALNLMYHLRSIEEDPEAVNGFQGASERAFIVDKEGVTSCGRT